MGKEYSKLTQNEIKRSKIFSRFISIVTRIFSFICWFATGIMILSTVALCVILPNTEVNKEEKTITTFGQKVGDYHVESSAIKIMTSEGSESTIVLDSATASKIESFIEDNFVTFEILLGIIFATTSIFAVFVSMILGHAASIFDNIADEDTPFVLDNVCRMKKVFKYMITILVIQIIASIPVLILTSGTAVLNFGCVSIISLFGAYVAVYLFRNGYELANKKAAK